MSTDENISHVSPRRAAMRAKREQLRLARRRENIRYLTGLALIVLIPLCLPALTLPFLKKAPAAGTPKHTQIVEPVRYDNAPAEGAEGLSTLRMRSGN